VGDAGPSDARGNRCSGYDEHENGSEKDGGT